MYTFLICENSTSSLALAEESSAACFSDIPASALSRLNLTVGEFSCNGSETECCHHSQSGTTSEPSTEHRGEGKSMSFAEDSLAKTSLLEIQTEKALPGPEVDCGEKWQEWFAKWDQNTCSWKTPQGSLLAGLDEFLGTWPSWGIAANGVCLELEQWEGIASENEFGLLPGPQRVDGAKWYVVNQAAAERRVKMGKQLMLIHVVGLTAYTHLSRWLANPPFWEAMMGWPIGWTDCTPLETDSIQKWQQQHSGF